ncbi:probable G-protein coupled receptor Mth-like 11, partial [Stegodyphus dumicola]|uniref:probable G-protein coupled receptor Mth-like 11 n=1 Tax=Stegodyphus dumicola TaxID=202533 RepID=UPI0015A9C2F2
MAGKDLVFTVNETDINFATGNFTSQKPVLNKYYPILAAEMGLSIFCSTALIFVYIIIGEHRTVPGKNVISISLCLIITYIMLTIDLLMRNNLSHALCMVVGVIVQTTFLATFFWTNVMSYDIMITMASVKSDAITTFKYWKYSVYAWTMTLLCVVPAVVVDNIDEIPNEYKPRFGVKKCWISGQLAFLIYLNAPVGVTLTANCVFFILTAKTIIKVRRSTAILATNRHKKRYSSLHFYEICDEL